MNKTDWGAKGFIVTGSYYRDRPLQVHEVKIDRVGTKYVYSNRDRFCVSTGIQVSDYGDKCRMFPDRESATEYVDRSKLIRQLSKYTSGRGDTMARKMPLPKLKRLIEMFESEEEK